MSDKKDTEIKFAEGVIYKPCDFCGSEEYDSADGDVVSCYEGQVFKPESCDQCKFGTAAPAGTIIH